MELLSFHTCTVHNTGGSRPPSVSLCIVRYYTSPKRRRWRRRGKKEILPPPPLPQSARVYMGIVWRGRGLWKEQRMERSWERRRGRFASLADVSREKIQEKKVAEGGGREVNTSVAKRKCIAYSRQCPEAGGGRRDAIDTQTQTERTEGSFSHLLVSLFLFKV